MSHHENVKKILVSGVSSQSQLDNDNKDNILSPNSQKIKLQQIIGVANERDYLRGQQSSSGSSGNESPSSSHSIKHDNDEFSAGKQDDTAISHLSNSAESKTGNSLIVNGSVRCIASVFSGHAKLKRLLGTLVQFANNISTETGDTVRTLVLGLLVRFIYLFFYLITGKKIELIKYLNT